MVIVEDRSEFVKMYGGSGSESESQSEVEHLGLTRSRKLEISC